MKTRPLLLLTTALLLGGCNDNPQQVSWFDALKVWLTGNVPEKYLSDTNWDYAGQPYPEETATGNYLSGRFAQSNFDWEAASRYFTKVLDDNPNNMELERRAMVLAMGAGQYKKALNHARAVTASEENGSLPKLFLSLETFKSENYAQVLKEINSVPDDGISEFVKPLIKSWAAAGLKKTDIAGLNKNVVHFFHAVLIADYLNDEAALKMLAARDYSSMGLSLKSMKQISEIFEKRGIKTQISLLLNAIPDEAMKKIGDEDEKGEKITSPVGGMSKALFDMASVLYQDYPDSARLFAELSLYLDPSRNDSRILMAHMAAQFKRYNEAISIFNQIDDSKNPELAIKVDRQIAELLQEAGKTDEAVATLRGIVKQTGDIDAQIQIGDIFREKEDYSQALTEYNKAFNTLNGEVPAKYWNLLYARGITHERMKNWKAAEKDLKSALMLEPDHPYILNYLGYSWTDQGVNLTEATRMIEKAAKLRPEDGFIIDSLGWAYYRQGRYPLAVDALERAIALSPNDPTINDHLGDAYWQVGRKSEARFQWKRALSFRPDAELEAKINEKIENGLQTSSMLRKTPEAEASNKSLSEK